MAVSSAVVPDMQNAVLDALWARYALGHLRDLVTSDTEKRIVFSIGPSLSSPIDFFMLPLGDFVNPDPKASMEAAVGPDAEVFAASFDFLPPAAVAHGVGGFAPRDGGAGASSDVAFFRVVDLNPAGRPLAPSAPKITQSDGFGVQFVQIRSCDYSGKKVYAALEGLDGTALQDFQIFTASAINFTDVNTMRIWKEQPDLHYDFGFNEPVEMQGDMQEVYKALLQCVRPQGGASELVLAPSDSRHMEKVRCLKWLQAHGRVHQAEADSNKWSLTGDAMGSVQVSNVLRNTGFALRPRADKPDMDKNIFELLSLMSARGWVCYVQETAKRGKGRGNVGDASRATDQDNSTPKPQDYVAGDRKIWWVKPKQKTIFRNYLLCLLFPEAHGKSVPHFKTERFYTSLWTGEDYVKKGRRSATANFDFQVLGEGGEGVAVKSNRKALRGGGKQKIDDPVVGLRISEDGDGHDDSSDVEASASGSGSSRSGSSSSSSTSSSSSNRHTDNDIVGVGRAGSSGSESDIEAPPPPQLPPSLFAIGRQHAGGASASSGGQREFSETTTYWRDFKITVTKTRGQPSGYEATCYITSHNAFQKCTRTRAWRSHGGQNDVLRKLKWWCLQGHSTFSREAHFAIPDPDIAQVPTSDELDDMPVESEQLTIPPSKHRRHA